MLSSFHLLHDAVSGSFRGFDATMSLSGLRHAMDTDAFKNGFHFEPIFSQSGIIAYEALARPYSNGQGYEIQKLANQFYALGHHEEFDLFTFSHVLKRAKNFPVSINIAPASLLNPDFCDSLLQKLEEYGVNPHDIIIEIVEHDVNPHANVEHLKKLTEKGIRLSLDDLRTDDPKHVRRLALFGPLTSIFKVDGELVHGQDALDLKSLATFAEDIKKFYPQAILVAEHVQNFDHAQRLFKAGFDGVQGFNLKAEDFTLCSPLDLDLSQA